MYAIRSYYDGFENSGAHGRAEAQGTDRRDQNRGTHGDGELAVELTRDAGHESHRDEHGKKDQGGGHDGTRYLPHGLDGLV